MYYAEWKLKFNEKWQILKQQIIQAEIKFRKFIDELIY